VDLPIPKRLAGSIPLRCPFAVHSECEASNINCPRTRIGRVKFSSASLPCAIVSFFAAGVPVIRPRMSQSIGRSMSDNLGNHAAALDIEADRSV
jgi:hypothetical protein